MADQQEQYVTIDQILDAVVEKVKAGIPELVSVDAYDALSGNFPTPAARLSVIDVQHAKGKDIRDGLYPAHLRFAFVLIDREKEVFAVEDGEEDEPDHANKRQLMRILFKLIVFLQDNRFGLVMDEPATVTNAYSNTLPDADQAYDDWSVEFDVSVKIGVPEFIGNDAVARALYSFSPDIGKEHKDDYKEALDEVVHAEPDN